jgi:hypothetical protein
MLDSMSDNLSEATQGDADKATKKSMARSEIAFPYVGLEDAVVVARAIYENGASLSRDQIAGFLRLKTAGLRIGAARLFGLVSESPDGKVSLTDLAVSILSSDEAEAKAARRDAFLKVPLYSKAFETFRNRNLPVRPHGLEQSFVDFGVAPKQKDKARQAFERSASFAGFFDISKDRLVEPIINRNAISNLARPWQDENAPPQPKQEPEGKETLPMAANEFLIKGLLDRLPPTSEKWAVEERARWLKALSVNLEMIYGDGRDIREIEIKVQSRASSILKSATETSRSVASPKPKTDDLDDDIPF